MEPILSIAVAAGLASLTIGLAITEHKREKTRRSTLLDDCHCVLSNARSASSGDSFPRLIGCHLGATIRAELIPDSMTIKRLPQLWLSVTRMQTLPINESIAVLVRPSGNDFYSLTEKLQTTLSPTHELPWEVLVRGNTTEAQALLTLLSVPIGKILADPRVKEVAITPKGLRIVRQASEGRRGAHLLLRQAVFDNAAVPARDLEQLLITLDRLAALLERPQREQRKKTA